MILFLETISSSIKQVKAPYMFDGEHGIALQAVQGIGPHLAVDGKSHGFYRVAVETWSISLSYGGHGPSKLVFVQ